jgi:hypothetical protein
MPSPKGVLADDVLLREGPYPFGIQNASHHHMLSLAGYLQSTTFHDTAAPLISSHGYRPWLQPQTYYPYQTNTMLAFDSFTLPGDPVRLSTTHGQNLLTSLQPSSDCLMPGFVWIYHYWRPMPTGLSHGYPCLSPQTGFFSFEFYCLSRLDL